MDEILEFLAEKFNVVHKTSDREKELDIRLREELNDEHLKDYLELQDLIASRNSDAEKESYKRGFVEALHFIKELSKI